MIYDKLFFKPPLHNQTLKIRIHIYPKEYKYGFRGIKLTTAPDVNQLVLYLNRFIVPEKYFDLCT